MQYDEYGDDLKESQNSLGSAVYMQQLNALTLERVNIAQKLVKGTANFNRKMSVCIEDIG